MKPFAVLVGLAAAVAAQSSSSHSSSSPAASSQSTGTGSATSTSGAASTAASSSSSSSSLAIPAPSAVSTAQNTSSIIPTSLSPNCTAFLNQLNDDPNLNSCTQPLLTATSKFLPPNNQNVTAQLVTSTLQSLCSQSGCTDSLIRSYLADFYSACSDELTGDSPSEGVRDTYDILYVLQPMKEAVCSKDSSGNYCLLEIATSAGTTGVHLADEGSSSSSPDPVSNAIDTAINYLYTVLTPSNIKRRALPFEPFSKRGSLFKRASQGVITQYAPNATTYRTTYLPYLFLSASLPTSKLCTDCAREILASYFSWEAAVPYVLGLTNSPILGSQVDLWDAIESKCPANFSDSILSAAGTGLSASGTGAVTTGAASPRMAAGSLLGAVVLVALGLAI